MTRKVWLWCCVLVLSCGCQRGRVGANGNNDASTDGGAEKMTVKLTSTAFQDGGMIPAQYTCEGQNISPPLAWGEVPAETKTLALVADDPDAPRGTWVHWVLFNLPATERGLAEATPATETLASGAKQGKNDFGNAGYGGPCPPAGTHRYYFKLYALDAALDLPSGASKEQLSKAMRGHVVAEGELMGRYQRTRG